MVTKRKPTKPPSRESIYSGLLRLGPAALKTYEKSLTCDDSLTRPDQCQLAAARDVIRKIIPDNVNMELMVKGEQNIKIRFE